MRVHAEVRNTSPTTSTSPTDKQTTTLSFYLNLPNTFGFIRPQMHSILELLGPLRQLHRDSTLDYHDEESHRKEKARCG